MKCLACFVVLGVAACSAPYVSAAAISDLQPLTVNQLQDTDYENLFNMDIDAGNPIAGVNDGSDLNVEQGDILYGVFQIDDLRVPPGTDPPVSTLTNATFTGFFALAVRDAPVTSTVGMQEVATYNFRPLTDAEWAVLFGPTGAITSVTRSTSDTVAFMVDDSTPDDGSSFLDVSPAGGTTVGQSVQSGLDGTLLWEFGFVDTQDFWSAETRAASGNDPTNIAQIITGPTSNFSAGISVTAYHGGMELLEHDGSFPAGSFDYLTGVNTFHELILTGSIDSRPAPGTNNFSLQTDADLYIVPTPEPATLALWGAGGLIALAAGSRRRRSA